MIKHQLSRAKNSKPRFMGNWMSYCISIPGDAMPVMTRI